MSLNELKPKTRELVERFSKIEPKRWSIEGSTMELMTEVGDLTELILRKEYYKRNIHEDIDYQIRDELADIIFILVRLADSYNIDLDAAYDEMEKQLNERLIGRGV